ncbi:MAG: hypothetical protein EP343_17720 [Deltaproteobacteria bacterium]|nr:MAG: hypothetical protein EP343_17720 [Deltaproteobacteria bacterium]
MSSHPTYPVSPVSSIDTLEPLHHNVERYGERIALWLERMQPRFHALTLGIFIMNVLDGWLTIVWVQLHLATEANPLMDALLQIDPGLFMAGKLSLIFLSLRIVQHYRHRLSAVLTLLFAFGLYSLIMAYHLLAMTVIILFL